MRVLETSEGVVASSSMDAVIVVVDFREKDGSVPSVSFGSDDDDDDEEDEDKNGEDKKTTITIKKKTFSKVVS